MRLKLDATEGSRRVQQSLKEVRTKLPELWRQASTAVTLGQEHLARLGLRRRLVVLHELESMAELIASQRPLTGLAQRLEAANRLLDASLAEVAHMSIPPPRDPPAIDFDPAVEADLAALRAQVARRGWPNARPPKPRGEP